MPPEYQTRGRVSPRTDAFAFGMVAIELLTGLHPMAVRELIDEYPFEQLPGIIQQHHDGEAADDSLGTIDGIDTPSSPKCEWPLGLLGQLALMAAKCSRPQSTMRTAISEVLPELEEAAELLGL